MLNLYVKFCLKEWVKWAWIWNLWSLASFGWYCYLITALRAILGWIVGEIIIDEGSMVKGEVVYVF